MNKNAINDMDVNKKPSCR